MTKMKTPSTGGEYEKTPNKNPWYVLATIYGEQFVTKYTGQKSSHFDRDLHKKNCAAWNAWACQNLTDTEKNEINENIARDVFSGIKPWSEVSEEIEKAFKERLPNTDLPDPNDKAIFSSYGTFERGLNFSSFIFPAYVFFGSATIKLGINLDYAVFTKTAFFADVAFEDDATFRYTAFKEDAVFSGATFHNEVFFGDTVFSESPSFISTVFTEYASFHSVTFSKGAIFSDAVFQGETEFGAVDFQERASFRNVKFIGETFFNNATFSGNLIMSGSVFEERSHFQYAKILAASEFNDVEFVRPSNFREAIFKTQYPELEGSILNSKTTLTAMEGYWPDGSASPNADSYALSCSHLRKNMADQGLFREAHFFFRREQTYRAVNAPVTEKTLYLLYKNISEFGISVVRPILGLIAIWIIGAVAFWTWGEISPLQAIGLSFSNIFKFFGFHGTYFEPNLIKSFNVYLEMAAGTQTVLGYVLLFFLGLGLRNIFRVK